MKKIFFQIVHFVGISGAGWLIDFFIFTILGFFSKDLVINNIFSSWIAVTFVFIFATKKVFKSNDKISLRNKYIIYILYQVILIFLISKLLGRVNLFIIEDINILILKNWSSLISKIVVTPITMTLNFIVMKFIVEKI